MTIDGPLQDGRPLVEIVGTDAGDANGLLLGPGGHIQVLGLSIQRLRAFGD
ncbi:MAG TPA: hypothetical protein VE974_07770 [Thermoanaerobaculia bacterium]|nr:hypothetical protein [Thermoanaerobaculia bacterium]